VLEVRFIVVALVHGALHEPRNAAVELVWGFFSPPADIFPLRRVMPRRNNPHPQSRNATRDAADPPWRPERITHPSVSLPLQFPLACVLCVAVRYIWYLVCAAGYWDLSSLLATVAFLSRENSDIIQTSRARVSVALPDVRSVPIRPGGTICYLFTGRVDLVVR